MIVPRVARACRMRNSAARRSRFDSSARCTSESPIPTTPPNVPVGLPSDLLRRRPDIRRAEAQLHAATARIGVATAELFPKFSLTGSLGLEGDKPKALLNWSNRFWSIGPAFTETIFDSGRRRAVVRQAEASYDATVAIYRQDVLTAFQDVEDNLAALRILSDEATQQGIANEAAQRSLDLTLIRYRGGITIYTEVITAQNALLADQRAAIGVRTRRMAASVLLVKALGGGWDRSQLPQ